eukprot:scaffold1149_cov173-Skeletonema_marinoi.AAC.5
MSISITNPRSSLRGSTSSSSARHLAEIVVTAAESHQNQKINKRMSNVAQLRISDMQLHGRDDDIKLLRRKLRELTRKKDGAAKNHVGEMILVSGTSGTGKSTLIHKGLAGDASKIGYIFVSGKFEDKLLRPLSAFSDAMSCLAKYITVEHNNKMGKGPSTATLLRDKIQNEFDEDDMEQLRQVLPGCAELLGTRRYSLPSSQAQADAAVLIRSGSGSKLGDVRRRVSLTLAGNKESKSRMHNAVRRLLKIICPCLKGVVLFIDDLQWSDTATLDLLKSIILDGEIPRLLIVGAYREDEVPE